MVWADLAWLPTERGTPRADNDESVALGYLREFEPLRRIASTDHGGPASSSFRGRADDQSSPDRTGDLMVVYASRRMVVQTPFQYVPVAVHNF